MIKSLRCPQSHQPLQPAPQEVTAQLLARRENLRNRDGEIPALFEGGFLTADSTWFYPQRGGIPVLLPGEAIPTTSVACKPGGL